MQGFPSQEFRSRLAKAQRMMSSADLDALLLTTEVDIRYFTGFLTRFWESPTRPWYLVVPQTGQPVAVIPSIGAALMGKTWIEDIRTWSAPNLEDDGVSLLADTLMEISGKTAMIGVPSGHESHIRMPHRDFVRLQEKCGNYQFTDDHDILRNLRSIKSDLEIDKIKTACVIAGRAFDRVGEIASQGVALSDVFRKFQMLCLEEGADWVPYLAGGKGPIGYGDVISPATSDTLVKGEVMMLDTGLVHDGYFCDYDRNYAVGMVKPVVADAWSRLLEATEAGIAAAHPGNTAGHIYRAMDAVLTAGKGGGAAGRLGHGLGMQLTEGMSFIPDDNTVIEESMVITLEPGITMDDGSVLVHEDDFVITGKGAAQLSPNAPKEMWII